MSSSLKRSRGVDGEPSCGHFSRHLKCREGRCKHEDCTSCLARRAERLERCRDGTCALEGCNCDPMEEEKHSMAAEQHESVGMGHVMGDDDDAEEEDEEEDDDAHQLHRHHHHHHHHQPHHVKYARTSHLHLLHAGGLRLPAGLTSEPHSITCAVKDDADDDEDSGVTVGEWVPHAPRETTSSPCLTSPNRQASPVCPWCAVPLPNWDTTTIMRHHASPMCPGITGACLLCDKVLNHRDIGVLPHLLTHVAQRGPPSLSMLCASSLLRNHPGPGIPVSLEKAMSSRPRWTLPLTDSRSARAALYSPLRGDCPAFVVKAIAFVSHQTGGAGVAALPQDAAQSPSYWIYFLVKADAPMRSLQQALSDAWMPMEAGCTWTLRSNSVSEARLYGHDTAVVPGAPDADAPVSSALQLQPTPQCFTMHGTTSGCRLVVGLRTVRETTCSKAAAPLTVLVNNTPPKFQCVACGADASFVAMPGSQAAPSVTPPAPGVLSKRARDSSPVSGTDVAASTPTYLCSHHATCMPGSLTPNMVINSPVHQCVTLSSADLSPKPVPCESIEVTPGAAAAAMQESVAPNASMHECNASSAVHRHRHDSALPPHAPFMYLPGAATPMVDCFRGTSLSSQ